jgi:Galactose mutarotase and related enzymes
MDIQKEPFGIVDGKEVFLFTLSNDNHITVKITNYGGIITSLTTPDPNGKIADVVLGFHHLQDYQAENPFFGALVGRYGNRIADARFILNGKEYQLARNDGKNHLHGGIIGFNKVVWDAAENRTEHGVELKLAYLSKDGEEGYPGNLRVNVSYLLNDRNELVINYTAATDKTTVVNLTQHSYFNLSGEASGTILGHEMMINADQYTAVNDELIPTGELKTVKGSALDFTKPETIGARIGELTNGYDHNYVLNKNQDNEPTLAAKVYDPNSERRMEVYTTEPGVQFYTGNFLDGTLKGKAGKGYVKNSGFCLETQHYPDSPNQPAFPTTVLNPGDTYKQVTIYKFI